MLILATIITIWVKFNGRVMKKIIIPIIAVAAFAAALVSCQKQEVVVPDTPQEVTLTFSSEKPAFDDETKTEWTGETIQWSAGDKIAVAYTVKGNWQNASGDASGDAKLYKSTALEAAAETAKFNVSADFTGETEGTHVFYGVYPAPSATGFPNAPVATLTVPSTQTPTASSFDGTADLMTGVSVGDFQARPAKDETISMAWTRLVAHANITLKALNGVTEGETVSSIKLTAQEGANLVGSQKVNIITNEVTNNNKESNILELNGGNLTIAEGGNIEFWACILPETLTSLTVVVETNKATYTREITEIEKTFMRNARNILSINMSTAAREAKEEVSWVLVTPDESLTEGTYVLVASTKAKTGALVSTNGSSSAPTFNTSVSVSDNTLNGVTEAMQFDLSGTTGNYKLAVTGQTTNYLYTTATNNGVRVGTNANNVWTIGKHASNADAFVFKCNETSRYLGVYNDADWRCYTTYDATNYTNDKGSSQIYLYKKQSGPVVPDTTPKLEVPVTSIELNSSAEEGTVEVTAKNVASVKVRALVEEGSQSESDWLTVNYTDGVITYSAEANEYEEPRTACIEVMALDVEQNVLVKNIAVTQNGLYVPANDLEAGEYWVMATKNEETRAMTPITATYGYAQSEAVTDNRSYAKNIFTFTAVDGGYTISDASGNYYYQEENTTYKTFNVGNDNTLAGCVWTVSLQDDGTAVVMNAASKKMIKYGDGTYTSFGVYGEDDGDTGVFPVLVKADNPLPVKLSSISVIGHKTSFTEGEAFEFGGTVTATYTDGSTKEVTDNVSVTAPELMEDGASVTVSYTEEEITKTFEYQITVRAEGDEVTEITESISFVDTNHRVSQDAESQVWANGGVTFTNAKGSSSTAVGDYSNPVRLYQGSTVTVTTDGNITKITIESDGTTKYKTALQDSLTKAGYEYTNSSNSYTVSLSGDNNSMTFSLTAQARFKSISVTYQN